MSLAACADSAPSDVSTEQHDTPCDPANAIVFAATFDGQVNTDLYLVAPHHRKPTRLTHSDAPILFPAWSPDHTRIAFIRNLQVFVLDVAAGDEHLVAPKAGRSNDPYPAEVSGPAWSPDGTRLVYPYPRDPEIVDNDGPVDESYRTSLHIVNADGTNDVAYNEPAHTNPTGVGTLAQPAWSSTDQLAFSAADDCPDCAGGEWYSLSNSDGSGYQQVPVDVSINSMSPEHDLDWSPDATRWVYTAGLTTRFEKPGRIVTRSVASASDAKVIATDAWYPRYAADGGTIAFLKTDGVYVMNADGTGAMRLIHVTGVRGLDW